MLRKEVLSAEKGSAENESTETDVLTSEGKLQLEWWRPQIAWERPSGNFSTTSVPFWAVIGFTFMLLFSPQAYIPALAPFRPALLMALVGIGSYVYDRFSRDRPLVLWTREVRLIAYLAGWAAVTAPFSIWPGGSLAFLIDQFFRTLAIFWLLSHTVATEARLRRLIWALSLMAVGLGCLTASNFLSGSFFDQGLNQLRVIGTEGMLTKNPNDLALMINLIVPLTVGLYLSNRNATAMKKGVLLCTIGVEIVTVVLTYSRAGALTLAAIVGLYAWKLRRRAEKRIVYMAVIGALLCVPLLPSGYFDRLSTIANIQADRTGSAQERWADMVIALQTAAANPLKGSGIGMNVLTMNESRGGWRAVHNVYLEHAIDLGLPGVALFVLALIACVKATVVVQRRCAEAGSRELFYLAEGIQVSLIAYAVAAMFHPVSYHFFFYYVAGLAVAAKVLSQGMAHGTPTA